MTRGETRGEECDLDLGRRDSVTMMGECNRERERPELVGCTMIGCRVERELDRLLAR